MTNLSDIEKRILDKLDGTETKIDTLCNRMTKVEIALNNHFAEIDKTVESKWRKRDLAITIVTVVFGIYVGVRELFG